MWKKLIFVLVIMCVLMPRLSDGQEAKAVLDGVAKAMGDVKSLQYTGSGSTICGGPERGSRGAMAAFQRQKLHPDDQLRHGVDAGRDSPYAG